MDGDSATKPRKARVLGINHVVLEVGDLDEALEFYGSVFDFNLRGRGDHNAFIGMGDQFIQLTINGRDGGPDTKRHFGLVVEDREGVAGAVAAAGGERVGERLNFRDPWGNRIEVVSYAGIQFTKADHILAGMGVGTIEKTEEALKELAEAGMAPGGD
jgi:catechol 2,3-dioxygenase-like lactoylglutathione lyase family enzyme